jgi:predicted flap endonuclease-1-like 5' DNA nuclease
MARILDIEGIGAGFATKLREAGIRTTAALLKAAGSKRGRHDLAAETGIPEKLILEWVNLADLMRIRGVGEEFSDLLEEAGVDTVKELARRDPENLYAALHETNMRSKLVRRMPSRDQVADWVEQARSLPAMVTH